MVTAMGNQKHAVLLPFKGFFGAAVIIPDGGETSSRNHVYDFIERKLKRACGLTCRNLGDPRGTHSLLSHQLDECGHALTLFPPAEAQSPQVFYIESLMDGDPQGFHPVVVGELFAPHRSSRFKINFRHSFFSFTF
jgi:hypothetical protein